MSNRFDIEKIEKNGQITQYGINVLADIIEEELKSEKNKNVVITVLNEAGNIFMHSGESPAIGTHQVSYKKALAALHFRKNTIIWERDGREPKFLGENYCAFGGAIPIFSIKTLKAFFDFTLIQNFFNGKTEENLKKFQEEIENYFHYHPEFCGAIAASGLKSIEDYALILEILWEFLSRIRFELIDSRLRSGLTPSGNRKE